MKSFLVAYVHSGGALTVQEFSDAPAALAARMSDESKAGPNTEIVVLSSDSESSLRQTHSRYFHSMSEILLNSADALRSGVSSARQATLRLDLATAFNEPHSQFEGLPSAKDPHDP